MKMATDSMDQCYMIQPKEIHRAPRKAKITFYAQLFFTVLAFVLLGIAFIAVFRAIRPRRNRIAALPVLISPYSFPNCGKQVIAKCEGNCRLSRSRRLVGGSTTEHRWPWMAEIVVKGRHQCGGVMVNKDTILTAAHCVYQYVDYSNLTGIVNVRLGIIDRREASSSYAVKSIKVHYKFNPLNLLHDIALLKLEASVVLSESLWPICLPTRPVTMPVEYGIARVAGWGRRFEDGRFTNELLEVSLPVVSAGVCKEANKGIFKQVSVTENSNICAGFGGSREEYGCKGDSGGPLIVQASDGRWVTIGILSWGDPTCSSKNRNSYTVFSRVDFYEYWIANQLS